MSKNVWVFWCFSQIQFSCYHRSACFGDGGILEMTFFLVWIWWSVKISPWPQILKLLPNMFDLAGECFRWVLRTPMLACLLGISPTSQAVLLTPGRILAQWNGNLVQRPVLFCLKVATRLMRIFLEVYISGIDCTQIELANFKWYPSKDSFTYQTNWPDQRKDLTYFCHGFTGNWSQFKLCRKNSWHGQGILRACKPVGTKTLARVCNGVGPAWRLVCWEDRQTCIRTEIQ